MNKLKVLVADDDQMNRTLVCKLLEKFDTECSTAEDGKIALDKVFEDEYDIIFLDFNMPRLSGLECAKLIRSHYSQQAEASPMIIGISADEDTKIDNVFDEFLPKPFKIQRLKDIFTKVRGEA